MDKNSGHVYLIRMAEYKLCTQTVDNLSTFVSCVESELQLRRSNFADGRGHAHDHLYRVEAGKFLFRGQSADWPLRPKLARLETEEDLRDVERVMLEEFARLSLPFTKGLVNDSWDRLALAQHHGLPTRLLDWTFSAMAALWFAVSGKPAPAIDNKDQKRVGVVWILRPAVADFIRFRAKDSPSEPTDRAFEVADSPLRLVRTRVFLPRVVADRISAQSGVFTIHEPVDNPTPQFVPLEEHPCFATNLVKIPIRAEHFDRLRDQLHHCGINSSTIYPDLGGLCQHLEWSFTRQKVL